MDKSELLKRRLNTATVDIPGVGTITVRGLSRYESLDVGSVAGDLIQLERKALLYGVVDPQLTEEEVIEWHSAASSEEIDAVVKEIFQLSGLGSGAVKTAYKSTDE